MKFLIADDHQLVREGLKHTIHTAFPGSVFILEASDAREVIDIVEDHPDLDLVLLDYYMPGADGSGLLSTLCDRYPEIPVVILSASDDPALIQATLDYGASGFVTKSTSQDVLVNAIRLVLSGGVYLPPALIAQHISAAGGASGHAYPLAPVEDAQNLERLTDRQVEVLALIAQGKSNKDISRQLMLSENTIKVHVTAIFKILGVNNRTQAVLIAQRFGLKKTSGHN